METFDLQCKPQLHFQIKGDHLTVLAKVSALKYDQYDYFLLEADISADLQPWPC